MSCPLFLLGVNQHVGDSNAAHRRALLQTVAHMHTLALASGGLFALLGNMNAAPEGGRWGYSLHSNLKTREADRLTLEWAHQCVLKEVPNIQRHATWKASLHPRKAILDRAWVSPPDLLFSSLSTLEYITTRVRPCSDHVPSSSYGGQTGIRWNLPPPISHRVAAALPGGP